MKKLILAFAAAGTLSLAALGGSTTAAQAKGWGGHGGGHSYGHGHGHGYGYGHFGVRHFGYRNYGYRYSGVRVVSVGSGSCWRYRWTPYGYRSVNVCVRPLYY